MFMTYYLSMRGGVLVTTSNVGKVKEQLSAYVAEAERGGRVVICRRNRPVAQIVPIDAGPSENRTCLGSAKESVAILCDLTQPAIPDGDWDALK